jgi:ABC-type Fe3+ transport system permease subunit
MQMMDFNFFSNPMILMFFMGGMVLFNIVLAIWIYQDAMNQNMTNASLWTILVLFTSFLGLIVYFLIKPANHYSVAYNGSYDNLNQPNNSENNEERFSVTGFSFCSSCGTKIEMNSKYCDYCGAKIK